MKKHIIRQLISKQKVKNCALFIFLLMIVFSLLAYIARSESLQCVKIGFVYTIDVQEESFAQIFYKVHKCLFNAMDVEVVIVDYDGKIDKLTYDDDEIDFTKNNESRLTIVFFSVILPIYNVEKYLSECVDSILKQTFTDYELILVDDGSKDGSPAICDDYAKKDERIKVIHKSNGGQSTARNMGLEKAEGEYIIYLDSDDFITSDTFFEDIYNKVQETQSDIVLYKYSKYFDDTKTLDKCTFTLDFAESITDSEEMLETLVAKDAYYGMAWVKAFRRKMAIENGVVFDTNLVCEDMDWYFNLVLCAEKISAIDKSYIAYRQREGSVTSSLKLRNLTDYIFTMEKWNEKIKSSDMSEKKKNALMGALAKYYSNMFITYIRVKDPEKKKHVKRIKAISSILDYSKSHRPQQIKKVYKLVGFKGVTLLLATIDKIK